MDEEILDPLLSLELLLLDLHQLDLVLHPFLLQTFARGAHLEKMGDDLRRGGPTLDLLLGEIVGRIGKLNLTLLRTTSRRPTPTTVRPWPGHSITPFSNNSFLYSPRLSELGTL